MESQEFGVKGSPGEILRIGTITRNYAHAHEGSLSALAVALHDMDMYVHVHACIRMQRWHIKWGQRSKTRADPVLWRKRRRSETGAQLRLLHERRRRSRLGHKFDNLIDPGGLPM